MAAALLLFATGYAIANRFQLTHGVLYRFAAGDRGGAVAAILFMAIQAAVFAAALLFVPRRWAVVLLAVAGPSILLSLGYTGIVRELIDGGSLAWLIAEVRQAGHAAGEFGGFFLWTGAQTAVALALFVAARIALRQDRTLLPWNGAIAAGLLALLLLPSLIYRHAVIWPESAERSLYGLGWDLLGAPPPPPRGRVEIARTNDADPPRHIVWLVDESVAEAPFARLIAPKLAGIAHLDFGTAAALGNCSAAAQVALRSGVDVRHANAAIDLRRTPSIWAYARGAGYRTMLIDGQTSGAPQNLMLPPERALIDDYRSMVGGIDTDLRIADALNAQMKRAAPSFTYVVLRGVHFQYRDHYPAGAIPADSPVARQYDTALLWSKGRFFERLLAGVDREAVAIVYTSDHGQNLEPGKLPHCSGDAAADEFRVPLLAFLPAHGAARYAEAPRAGHSASQIFPAMLGWMGYDRAAAAARYDRDLDRATARFVWFGRVVVPMTAGGEVDVVGGPAFPGTSTAGKRSR